MSAQSRGQGEASHPPHTWEHLNICTFEHLNIWIFWTRGPLKIFSLTQHSTHLVGFSRLMLTRTISRPMPSLVRIRSDINLTRLSRHSACWTGRPWTSILLPRSRVNSSTSAPISPTWKGCEIWGDKGFLPCPPSSVCLFESPGSQW